MGILHSAEVLQGESFPNAHTIRGTRYRQPQTWFQSIDNIRRFPAKFVVPSHGRPIAGEDTAAAFLSSYRDAIQFVYDQTLRYMNLGYLPEQLVEAVKLPESLASHPYLGDFYGGVAHTVRQIYVGELGWFNGDPTFLAPLNSSEASKRYLALMGGRDKVFNAAQQASQADDAQWSAELLTHILNVKPTDQEARMLKASNLKTLAYRLTNTNWRNWLLTSALELEGTIDYSLSLNTASPDLVRAFPSAAIIEGMRFKVDGARAAKDKIDLSINISVADEQTDFNLHIRNGVAAFKIGAAEHSQAHLSIPRNVLLKYSRSNDFAGAVTQHDATLVSGDIDALKTLQNYLDQPSKQRIKLTTLN